MKKAYNLTICHSVEDIGEDDWNRLANPFDKPFDPFISYAFFYALETSGSAVADTGWVPHHLLLHDTDCQLVGIMPLYLKSHSQGEYVFDHGWAQGFELAGGRYYPKLLCGVPFTPVAGRRILASPDNSLVVQSLLIERALALVDQNNLSSLHINFVQAELLPLLEDSEFLLREDTQFHWKDEGYQNFNGFLDALASRKRKAIRRERRLAGDKNIVIERLTGADIQQMHWDAFFSFYQDTGARKWGLPYLTRSFFNDVGRSLSDHIVLILAKNGERYIAGALNFIGEDTLYGRYWGAVEHHEFLHFEICYYQAIEFALETGLSHVEAGAQGEHKLARGYIPKPTYSAHFIAHDGLRKAVKEFLIEEGCYKHLRDEVLSAHLPYKKDR